MEETKMKKIVVIILGAMLALSATGCGAKTFICESCGQEKSGKQYELTMLGEKSIVCEDCADEIRALQNMFN